MLEDIPAKQATHVLLRLAASKAAKDTFDAMFDVPLDPQDLIEIRRLMPADKWLAPPSAVIRSQFEVRSGVPPSGQTRFSDGTKRVYYSALELQTTIAERLHWFKRESRPQQVTRLYLRILQCDFSGYVKDLVPHAVDRPFLTTNDGYSQCNALANEAIAAGLDALLTPSARHTGGICVPVFNEATLSNAVFTTSHVFEYVPKAGGMYAVHEI